MLINKPQFDTKRIHIGDAYYIQQNTQKAGCIDYSLPCYGLVEYVEPLRIKLIFMRTKQKSYDSMGRQTPYIDSIFIDADKVADESYILTKAEMREL